jgi:hypothetical protein
MVNVNVFLISEEWIVMRRFVWEIVMGKDCVLKVNVTVKKDMEANHVNREYARMTVLRKECVRMECVFVREGGKDKTVHRDTV